MIKEIQLVTRNARDKIQTVIVELHQNGNNFEILRITGQYQGKMTHQPLLIIEKGKARRSVIQQAELEFNSIINKYKNRGYKELSTLSNKKLNEIDPDDLNKLVSSIKSDANGNKKPMLAKDYNNCQNSILNKPMYCSKKLDGVRCMIKWDPQTNSVVTVSRGGKDYNVATANIRAELYDFFKNNPEVILDGELYSHGQYLQTISGIARKQEWDDSCNILEYWIYDIADDTKIFTERLEFINDVVFTELVTCPKIKILQHEYTDNWNRVKILHDRWVADGFEGLVARKPDKVYEFGKRTSTMIKVKEYKDDEFNIIDYKEGLREEDFCFICETKEGKAFSAKPIGNKELKAWYIENINNIIGQKGKIKFFDYSSDLIPQQPIFQSVRYSEDKE